MRTLNRCFIVVFMAMLTLPLIFVDLSSNRVSVKENRMLAGHPKLSDLKHHQGQFIRDFDAWFKDSTGFREQLLVIYNIMGMNKMSNVRFKKGQDVYFVGEKGHHFYVNDTLIKEFQGVQTYSDEQLLNFVKKLKGIKLYLEKKGIPFVVMICTGKEKIYPEFYPKSIKRGPEPIQLDIVTKYIQENTSVDFFNIRQALLAEKDNYLLYPVLNGDLTHYSEIAAFFAYRELMKHINIYFPEITPYELNDIDISEKIDMNGEIEPDVSLKTKMTYKRLAPSFFDDVELNRPFTWENTAYENTDANLPVILFFRDSYSGYYSGEVYEKKFLTQFIASHFSRAIFIHNMNMQHFEEYVDKYKPDIVVLEALEAVYILPLDIPDIAEERNGSCEAQE